MSITTKNGLLFKEEQFIQNTVTFLRVSYRCREIFLSVFNGERQVCLCQRQVQKIKEPKELNTFVSEFITLMSFVVLQLFVLEQISTDLVHIICKSI